MKTLYILFLLIASIAWGSCKEDQLIQAKNCNPLYKDIRRAGYVVDMPVIYRTSGGLASGGHLDATNGPGAWGSCNLPEEFRKDSLALYITGYSLTSPLLELMNVYPAPFEVTSATLR